MTRINVVPPKVLSNPHLMAEYRELPRIFTAVLKLQEQNKSPEDIDIPKNYCLGAGHCKYFYIKIHWLLFRFMSLRNELIDRNYNLDLKLFDSITTNAMNNINAEWLGSLKWEPSPEDRYLNMARLAKRSKMDNVLKELRE